MKPRIRKKGINIDGSNRYSLEFINNDGEFKAIALNPTKLLKLFDSQKKKKNSKEKRVENGR